MRLQGWYVGCPHSAAVTQITASSVKFCLSLSEVDCFCALWSETSSILWCILCFQQVFVFYWPLSAERVARGPLNVTVYNWNGKCCLMYVQAWAF